MIYAPSPPTELRATSSHCWGPLFYLIFGPSVAMKQNNKLNSSIVTSLNLNHFDLPKQQVTLIVLRNTEKKILETLPNCLTNLQSTRVYNLS